MTPKKSQVNVIASGRVTGELNSLGPFLFISTMGTQQMSTDTCGIFTFGSPLGTGMAFHTGMILPFSHCKQGNVRRILESLQRLSEKTYCDKEIEAVKVLEELTDYAIVPAEGDRSLGAIALKPTEDCIRMLCDNFSFISELEDNSKGEATPTQFKPFKFSTFGNLMEWFYSNVSPRFDSWGVIKIHVLFNGLEGCNFLDFGFDRREIKQPGINLEDYFQLRQDIVPSRIEFKGKVLNYGYGDFSIFTSGNETTLFLSDAYPPYHYIIRWLQEIECSQCPVRIELEEEGPSTYLEAHPTGNDDLILFLYGDQYETEISIQAIVDRQSFVDSFREALSLFVQEAFDESRWEHEPWEDEKKLGNELINHPWLHSNPKQVH